MLIYRLLISVLAPLLAIALLIRVLRKQESMRDFAERLGFWKNLPKGKVIWLHGASNGELTAARAFIDGLAARHPTKTLLITCNTLSARAMVHTWGLERAHVRLAPIDLSRTYRRLISRMDVHGFILFEADFWPNRLIAAKQCDTSLALIGGRISDKSAAGWAKFSRISSTVFSAFDLICAQDAACEKRLQQLGAKPETIGAQIALKSFYKSKSIQAEHASRQNTWLAASTHDGEDEALLNAHLEALKVLPDLRMILAPRHPKRAAQIAQLARALGLSVALRSEGRAFNGETDVYIADTLGEMDKWYHVAGVCFVAGSLVPKGGHTPFEPAFHDCALLHGPHLENFAEQYEALETHFGAQLCVNSRKIAGALIALQNEETASTLRSNAQKALAPTQKLDAILDSLDQLAKP